MFTPQTYSHAVATALMSTVCWGSWSVCLVHSSGKIPFEGFYVNYAIGIAAFSTLLAFTLGLVPGHEGHGDRVLFDDFDGSIPAASFLEAFAAGVIFNIANIGLSKSITLVGLTVAFPLGIGTALVVGTLVNYALFPAKNDIAWLSLGVATAFAAICCVSLVQMLKDRELAARQCGGKDSECKDHSCASVGQGAAAEKSLPERAASSQAEQAAGPGADVKDEEDVKVQVVAEQTSSALVQQPSLLRKLALCVTSGLLMGFWSPVASVAMSSGMTPYCELLVFSYAVPLSTFVLLRMALLCPLEGGPSQPLGPLVESYRKASFNVHMLAVLGGMIWDVGAASNAIAGDSAALNFATSYGIGQAAPMMGVLWGLLYFKEFDGTSFRIKLLLGLVLALFVGAIVLIALSAKEGDAE